MRGTIFENLRPVDAAFHKKYYKRHKSNVTAMSAIMSTKNQVEATEKQKSEFNDKNNLRKYFKNYVLTQKHNDEHQKIIN